MIDALLQAGLSNLLVSLALAGLAYAVQRRGRHPLLAHLLWLAVLIKLLTPPLLTLPLLSFPGEPAGAPLLEAVGELPPLPGPVSASLAPSSALALESPASASPLPALSGRTLLAWVWLLGSLSVLAVSLGRIVRFERLLRGFEEPAPPETQALARELAGRLGLARAPQVVLVEARLTPLLWWFGGRPRIVLPAALQRELDAISLRWVLAHELGHLRRRDHLVRWLEWLACVAFWWNPVAWWARRNLRLSEELCCDALVLGALSPEPREYAGSLLNVAEFLADSTLPTPAVASTLDGADSLERRIRMILSARPLVTSSRWARGLALLCALALLPLGVAQASEPDYEAVSDRLLQAVAAGELSPEQAEAMMGKLAKVRFAERIAELKAKGKFPATKARKGRKARAKRARGAKVDQAWISDALKELGLDPKQRKQVQASFKKVIAMARAKVNPEAYAWVPDYLAKIGLSAKQAEQVQALLKKAVAIETQSPSAPLEAKLRKFGLPAGALAKFRHALGQAGVTGKRQEQALGAVLKLAHVWRQDPKADHAAFHGEVKRYLVGELGLSGEQAGLVFGLAKETFAASQAGGRAEGKGLERTKLRQHYAKLGLEGPAFEKLSASLQGAGLEGPQLDQALRGLARLLYGQLKADSPQDALRAALAKHLQKSGFEEAQIEHMLQLAERLRPHLAQRADEGAKQDAVAKKLAQAYGERGVGQEVLAKVRHRLGQFGLTPGQTEGALSGILGVLDGLKAKGEGYELEPRLRGLFRKKLELNEKQLEQVLNLARRLSRLDTSR